MNAPPRSPTAQLLLDLPLDPRFRLETFVTGVEPHAALAAVTHLKALPAPCLTLVGERGAGKSHLLQGAVARARESGRAAVSLNLLALHGELAQGEAEGALAGFLDHHARADLVAVDDLDDMGDLALVQEALLYLWNGVKQGGGRMLLAARVSPARLPGLREDLRSRLLLGPVVVMPAPDEAALLAILAKLAADWQVRLPREVGEFLLTRLPRQPGAVSAAMAQLNQAALQRKRPLTIPLAKEVLGL